jgi:predicted signal transduction protein with EAL and GGDEF domain
VQRRHDNGAEVPVDVVLSAMDLDGEPTLLASIRDITDRKLYEAKIHQLAFYDALTGLPNRRLFFDRLAQAGAKPPQRAARRGDLPRSRQLQAGQRPAWPPRRRSAAAGGRPAPRPCLREEDTVARLGGDEFVALLVNVAPDHATTRAYVVEVAERIRDALARPYSLALGTTAGPPGQWSIGARRAWA